MAKRFLSNIRINDAYTFPASDGTNNQVIKTDGSGNLSFGQLATDSASVMYKDTFTGDGSTTGFTLANALNDEVQSNIYIDGVYQSKSTYSVSGTAITFSTAPLSGHEIEVISTTGINSGPTAIYTDTFTANGSATAFTLGQTVHSENQTIVFLNGVYQFKGTYTLSGTTLTLDTAPSNGVSIEVMSIGSAYSGGDILYDHDFTSAGLMTSNGSGVYSMTANNSANWNTAYGWGDHGLSAQDKTDIGNLSGTNTGDQDLSSYATQSYVGTQISNLVDSSPATLDTLNELAAALGDDPNFATTTATSIGTKMPLAGGTFTGNVLIGNTVTNPASGFGDQTGIGLKYSTTVPELQVSSDSTAVQLGRTTTGGHGQIMALRYASNTIHSFDTNNVSIGTNATFSGNVNIIASNSSTGSSVSPKMLIYNEGAGDSALQLAVSGSLSYYLGVDNSDNTFKIGNASWDSSPFMAIDTSGNVGIGGSPSEKLTIDGTTSGAYVRISNAASGDISSGYTIYNGSNLDYAVYTNPTFGNTTLLTREALAIRAGGSERMRITSGGNVGIGTAGYAQKRLDVSGPTGAQVLITGDSDDVGTTAGIMFRSEASEENGLARVKGGIFFERIAGSFGNGKLKFAVNGSVNNDTVAVTDVAMTIDNNKNVGIGNTSPASKLHTGAIVEGSFLPYLNGTAISFTTSTNVITVHDSAALGTNTAAGLMLVNNNNSNNAPSPLIAFSARSTSNTYNQTYAAIWGEKNSTGADTNWNTGSLIFATSTSTGPYERMRINPVGHVIIHENVGIGETAPASKLTVRKDSVGGRGGEISIVNYSSVTVGNEAALNFGLEGSTYNADNGNAQIKARVNNASNAATDMMFSLWNGGAFGEKMRIGSTGNVGIGETSPSEIFHVNKNATSRIVGAYFTNSQANTGAEAVSIAFGLNRSGGDFVRQLEAIEYGAENQWTGTPSTVNSYLAFNVLKGESAFERMRVNSLGVDVTSHGAHGVHLKPDSADTNNSGRLLLTRVGGSGWAVMNNAQNFSIRSGAAAGSTSGTEKIRLTGYSATSWTSGSDETIKENIKPIGNVLDKINDYRCVEYNLIDDETKDKKIGFIAQDWQEDFPQIIEQMENEKIGMKYTETIPILLKAIQELKADNDSLKARIETLENN